MSQTFFLDFSAPDTDWDAASNALWEVIFEANQPVPYPRQMPKIKDWKLFSQTLANRINAAISAICRHPTDNNFSRLRIGGPLGLFGMLRGIEILRRSLTIKELEDSYDDKARRLSKIVTNLGGRIHIICSREMWRRWASGSFIESSNPPGKVLALAWHVYMEPLMINDMDDEEVFIFPSPPYLSLTSRTVQSVVWNDVG